LTEKRPNIKTPRIKGEQNEAKCTLDIVAGFRKSLQA
ncbi:MAG: hypothetical protein ACI9G1_005215, partial [Pirellulaceae bacterium]